MYIDDISNKIMSQTREKITAYTPIDDLNTEMLVILNLNVVVV